jgi:hypothetical protein
LQVRFLPPQLERKGKPMGDGSRPENGRALSLEGSTPSPSAGCDCPRGAAWSARHPVTVEVMGSNPIGDARRYWPSGGMADTRRSERRAFTAWEFDFPLGHCGVDWSLVTSTVSYAVRRRFKSGLRNWIAPMVKRTIIPRFERGVPGSNPGRGTGSPVVQRAGRSHDMGKIAGLHPAGTTHGVCGAVV